MTRALSVGNLSNVYRACSFFTISDPFCIDNARVIGRKIRYIQKVTSMVKFSEVRKASEVSKYVSYWREVGGVKAASGVLGGSYLVGLLQVY